MYRSVIEIVAASAALFLCVGPALARADPVRPMVPIAEIEVDPARLASFKAILAEEQEASVRLEPGVLMLHSVAITDHPTRIRLLEVYASRSAYEAHLKTPHFVKYKTLTQRMVTSLELVPTTPILLCAKSNGAAGGPAVCM
ncbi:MAG: putative quinol monooxygenase [Janthinobacterium lividum]